MNKTHLMVAKKASLFTTLLFASKSLFAADLVPIGNTPTSIGISGKIHLDLLINNDDMGNVTGFSPATIPSTGNSGNLQTTMSAGQSKLAIHSETKTDEHTVKTIMEWDWYHTDNGSAPHLTQLWGEYGKWGAGQTFSVFMDVSTFPNTLEYFGPNSMVFVRQPQIRYTTPLSASQNLAFAIEKPNSAVTLNGLAREGHSALPDFTVHWRQTAGESHLQVAGILRQLAVTDVNDDVESTLGWGMNVSGNLVINEQDKISASVVVGEGIGRYINDTSFSDSDGVVVANGDVNALPVFGLYGFYDHSWNDKARSNIGYGYLNVDNEDIQAGDEFSTSHFFVINYLYQLAEPVLLGTELQWGSLEDKAGDKGENLRWQSSVIFKF